MLDWMTCRAGQAVCDDPCCAAACAQPGAGSAGAEGTHPPAGESMAMLLAVQLLFSGRLATFLSAACSHCFVLHCTHPDGCDLQEKLQMYSAAQVLHSWTCCSSAPPLRTVPHKKCPHAVPAEPQVDLPLVPATDMLSEPLVCLQGPTSSGKTSLVAYLAAQTGHTFVRINNHEQTDPGVPGQLHN